MKTALRKACSIDDDALYLGHAAQIVHKERFEFMDPWLLLGYLMVPWSNIKNWGAPLAP